MTTKYPSIEEMNESYDAEKKVSIEDLSCDEKTLSLVSIQCLIKQYPNDYDLGREIRKIFNNLKK
jgi:hypothetical protein